MVEGRRSEIVPRGFPRRGDVGSALRPILAFWECCWQYRDFQLAERVGFEPTYRLITDNSISSRARYDRASLPLRWSLRW